MTGISSIARLRCVLLVLAGLLSAQHASAVDVWRLAEVITPPWSKEQPSAATRALLGTGLVTIDSTVKGPPELACADATIRTLVVPWPDIFDGKVSAARLTDVIRALRLEGDATVVRVICGARTFDYYLTHESRVLLFDNALLIYRQSRDEVETKDLDDWVKPIRPGFDCKAAQSTAERLACTDYFLSRADRQMAERYAAVRARLSPEGFATVREMQRGWLGLTRARCRATGEMPGEWTEQRDVAGCLREAAEGQADFLAGGNETVGGWRLETRMAGHFRRTPPREDIIAYPWMSGSPTASADAFNRAITERLRPLAPYAALERATDDTTDQFTFARREYSIALFTERAISLTLRVVIYTGGAHEGYIDDALLFDVRAGRVLRPTDIFRVASMWEKRLTALCVARLKDDRPDETIDEKSVAVAVRSASAWSFGPKGATVHFPVYSILSFAAGPSDVEIGYDELRPFLRPGAPVP